jgi:hypothetical protein
MSDDEPEEWTSGPFCLHWCDPVECERLCACSHFCRQHDFSGHCREPGCFCEEFKDEDQK